MEGEGGGVGGKGGAGEEGYEAILMNCCVAAWDYSVVFSNQWCFTFNLCDGV